MTQPDSLDVLGGRPPRRQVRLTPAVRALAAVAVALMVAVVTLGVCAVRSAPHRLAVTVTPPALPAAMTTDAVGCPVHRLCTVRGTPPAALRAAFARHFPGST